MITDGDLRDLTDAELDDLRRWASIERERRDNLASIPHEIANLRAAYESAGGDLDALIPPVEPGEH